MPRYICYYRGLFFEWSTVVDAPVSPAMLPNEFSDYYKEEYGQKAWEGDFPSRIGRAISCGTSSILPMSISQMVKGNRAGDNEEELTLEEILDSVIILRKRYELPLIENPVI